MLLLGEEVAQLYKNIEHELSKPVVVAAADESTSSSRYISDMMSTEYKPVMKKRVYNLNSGYLTSVTSNSSSSSSTSDNNENMRHKDNLNRYDDRAKTLTIKSLKPDDKDAVAYYKSAGIFTYFLISV